MPLQVLRRGPAAGTAEQAAALRRFAVRAAAAVGVPRTEVTVVLTGDAEIAELNGRFRGAARPTDVLSFSYDDAWRRDPEAPLGDVVVSVPTAQRQARGARHGLERELSWLVLHGLLHLVGFDHERDCGEMAAVELALRLRLGV